MPGDYFDDDFEDAKLREELSDDDVENHVRPSELSSLEPLSGAPVELEWVGREHFEDLFVPEGSVVAPHGAREEDRNEFLSEKLEEQTSQNLRFKEAWRVRNGEVDLLEDLYQVHLERIEALESEVEDAGRRMESLKLDLESERRHQEQLRFDFEVELGESKEETSRREELLQGVKRELSQREAESREEIATLQFKLEGVNTANNSEKKRFIEESEKLTRLLNEEKGRAEGLEYENRDLSGDIKRARAELAETQESVELDMGVWRESIEAYKATMENQRRVLGEQDRVIEELNIEIESTSDRHSIGLMELENQISDSRISYTRLYNENNQRVESLEFVIQEREREINTSNQRASELEVRINAAQLMEGDLRASLASSAVMMEDLEGELIERDGEMENLSKELAETREQLESQKQALVGESQRLEELQYQLEEQVKATKMSVEVRDEAIDKLKASLLDSSTQLRESQEHCVGMQEGVMESRAAHERELSNQQSQLREVTDGLLRARQLLS